MIPIPIPGRPGRVDVVTINSGSRDLTLIRDIGHGGVGGPVRFAGTGPVAGLELDLGGGSVGLLVADNSDGRLTFFIAGPDGLELARLIEEPGLHPTALAKDEFGNVFVAFEGGETALLVSLGLGGVGGKGGGGIGASVLPNGPGEEQVTLLLPLRDSSALVAATLLSATIEETQEVSALVNQSTPGSTIQGPAEESDLIDDDEGPEPALPAQEETDADPLVQLVAGVDEAFDRARSAAQRRRLTPSPRPTPTLELLDEVLTRWAPAVLAAQSLPTALSVGLGRIGLASARAVDAAIDSLAAGASAISKPRDGGPQGAVAPASGGSLICQIGTCMIGLGAVSPAVRDFVHPRNRRRQGAWLGAIS